MKSLIDSLKGMRKIDYYDMFVYYYEADRLISGRYSPQDAASYYATYLADFPNTPIDGELQEEFMEILTTDYRKPMCHIVNEGPIMPTCA